MRIAQLTQAFNPLLLVLVLLQHITIAAVEVHQLNPSMLRHHPSHLSGMDQSDDSGDDGCDSDSNAGRAGGVGAGDGNCDMINRNSAKQTATNIAQKAAQEAEQAYGTQQCAAAEVAHQVKMQLADKAYTAAKAAEAALSGKQQMVDQLESELCESETALQQESASITNSQNNLNAACQSAKQALKLLHALQSIIKIAHENLANAKNAAAGAQQQLAEKAQLIETAQHRIETLKRLLKAARKDLENIKRSACQVLITQLPAAKVRYKLKLKLKLKQQKQHLNQLSYNQKNY
ncbi:uncharacterized protein LOC117792665 [Drosophila innubila]|uniref:uncharacterized protein LOC117792665 n=1 Tax=Drosophila innubila TaxID=198719 RepID=UPI00148C87FE|nr:uncharacterized protein LOC117792665 [Drosophila innubila]